MDEPSPKAAAMTCASPCEQVGEEDEKAESPTRPPEHFENTTVLVRGHHYLRHKLANDMAVLPSSMNVGLSCYPFTFFWFGYFRINPHHSRPEYKAWPLGV